MSLSQSIVPWFSPHFSHPQVTNIMFFFIALQIIPGTILDDLICPLIIISTRQDKLLLLVNLLFQIQSMIRETDPSKCASSTIFQSQSLLITGKQLSSKKQRCQKLSTVIFLPAKCIVGLKWSFLNCGHLLSTLSPSLHLAEKTFLFGKYFLERLFFHPFLLLTISLSQNQILSFSKRKSKTYLFHVYMKR